MATIYAGQSITELVKRGDAYTLTLTSASALVRIFSDGALVRSDTITATTTFGPFVGDVEIRTSCSSGSVSDATTDGVTASGGGAVAMWSDEDRTALVGAGGVQVPVSGAGIADASSLTLTTAHANTTRLPAGTQTYTVNGSTGWSVGDGIAVFLPASGTVSFAVSGGPTLNGATSTLTRTLAGNSIGYVVLNRIAGSSAYSLSGV